MKNHYSKLMDFEKQKMQVGKSIKQDKGRNKSLSSDRARGGSLKPELPKIKIHKHPSAMQRSYDIKNDNASLISRLNQIQKGK